MINKFWPKKSRNFNVGSPYIDHVFALYKIEKKQTLFVYRHSSIYAGNVGTQKMRTLESGIDVGQGITLGPGKFVKKNKHRALNKRRA